MSLVLSLLTGRAGKALAAVLAALSIIGAVWIAGKREGTQQAKHAAEKARADTLERITDADTGHADTDSERREWLRRRGER